MSEMFIVVKTAPGDAMTRLMTFLSENQMEFSVTTNIANFAGVSEQNIQKNAANLVAQNEPTISETKEVQLLENPIKTESGLENHMEDVIEEDPWIDIAPCSTTTLPEEYQPTSRKRRFEEEIFDELGVPKNGKGNKQLSCQDCNRSVKPAPSKRMQHVCAHLQLKPWQCTVCKNMLSRADKAKKHFQDVHSTNEYIPFVVKLTPSEKVKLKKMMDKCFPEYAHITPDF